MKDAALALLYLGKRPKLMPFILSVPNETRLRFLKLETPRREEKREKQRETELSNA